MTDSKGARGRRFAAGLSPDAEEVNSSVDFDRRLLAHDVRGSKAHASMLARQGLITQEDADLIRRGLDEVESKLASGELAFDPALEDVHMNVEARLIETIGDAGRRLHTGRSRNDQVATDLRLYCRASGLRIVTFIDSAIEALASAAKANLDVFMPGYTHLQRAQPVRAAHHFLAYVEMLERDRSRILDAVHRGNVSPLGSGALAATTHPLDRAFVAAELDFAAISRNSLDAVGDRDFAIELTAALALCQSHLSRLGEELVLWLSQEFAFARLSEAYCSASSLMPQKVNPDLAELLRGKAGRLVGDWVTLMTVVKGLPLAYNKDLQETQEPLYDAVETVDQSLRVAIGMIENLELDRARLANAVSQGHLLATELADYLVTKGAAFRGAHDIAGALVRMAQGRGVELAALSLDDLRGESPLFDEDVYDWLDTANAVDRRDLPGGPARRRVLAEIDDVFARLEHRTDDASSVSAGEG